MAMKADRQRGNDTERLALELLRSRGYNAELFVTPNYPVYDIYVDGQNPFKVSVKSSKKHQVAFGKYRSMAQLAAPNFLFAFIPCEDSSEVDYANEQYRLLILPAELARIDAIAVTHDYCRRPSVLAKYCINNDPTTFDGNPIVKQKHREVWSRWCPSVDAWHLLPPTTKS